MMDNFIQSFKWNLIPHWDRILLLINLQLPLWSHLNIRTYLFNLCKQLIQYCSILHYSVLLLI